MDKPAAARSTGQTDRQTHALDSIADERNLLTLADLYMDAHGIGPVKLSGMITEGKQSYLLSRIANRHETQRGILLSHYRQALQWFSDHWMDDVGWPADVLRPTATP